MASCEDSRRKKRAWRKPRQEIGPGVAVDPAISKADSSCKETHTSLESDPKPKKINRASLKHSEPSVTSPTTEPIASSATAESSVSSTKDVSTSMDSYSSCEGGGANKRSPLVIDGSVMEGVCMIYMFMHSSVYG